jgi:hypothetical protein
MQLAFYAQEFTLQTRKSPRNSQDDQPQSQRNRLGEWIDDMDIFQRSFNFDLLEGVVPTPK